MNELKKKSFEQELDKRTGYKPNNWQRQVRDSEARFKIFAVGRRGGKTLYCTRDSKDGLVVDLHLPNRHVWIVAPDYSLTQRVWDDLYNMCVGVFKPIIQRINNTKGNYKIETILGTVIEAKSADDPERLVGVGLNKIIVDEAAMLNPKAWTQSLRPTLVDHKGEAIFISTPKGKNWFWELWMKGQLKEEVEWESWRFTTYDNEYLDKAEIDALAGDMPDYEYRQEILAQFEETAEQIFRKVKERAISQEKEPERGHRYQVGVDLGRKTSKTVITVVDEMTDPYEVVHIDSFKTVDWTIQVDRIRAIWDKFPSLKIRVDATSLGGDAMVQDLENKGVRVDPFVITERTKREYIDKLAIFIDEGRIIYPPNKDLLNELETFGREISKDTGRVKYKPLGKFKEDFVSSLALATWGLPHKARRIKKDEDERSKYKPVSEITGY